jgi:hypothetical protein
MMNEFEKKPEPELSIVTEEQENGEQWA